ncbi:hypothetical protein AAFF_G00404650 [Aldrovandia affinis]|uniref:Mitochondrial assembly of ribosomal large subunit protein 1 n=1 Tax=Aldrovandia affinis TaxID=143900 RepID=A0AAD7T8R2_9TELE|nr:hypothetical protein AAFF_G00404650 [Aldrovandia affinis]
MISHAHMFRCSKRFLSKIFIHDVMDVNLRNVRNPRANVEFPHSISRLCRYTCFASRGKQLHSSRVRNSRFYTDMYGSACNLPEHRMSTLDAQKYSMDWETEKDLGQSTRFVFNIDVLVSLLRQENAADICVIKVPKEMMYTDYFIVVSGSSSRHLQAMAHYALKVYKYLKQDSDPNVQIEGKNAEDWMCIDFGDIVVHFMLPETREVYELEKLWALRSFDEQLSAIPPETLPKDFIYDAELPK